MNQFVLKPLGILMVVVIFMGCSDQKAQENTTAPTLKVVMAEIQTVPINKDFVGEVLGQKDIPIRARVEGFLDGIHFKEGSRVQKGDLLYTIDPQQLQAAVAAQKSALAEAEINLAHAKSDLDRIKPLAEINAVSLSDLDEAIAMRDASEAAVEAAQAQLEMAEIELGYTRIYSPINGIIGKTNVKTGEFISRAASSSNLNTVSEIDSILVQFHITESDYLTFARELSQNLKIDGGQFDSYKEQNKRRDSLLLIFSDNSIFEHIGSIDFIDRGVDAATGAILVQASFPNPELLVRPGQYGKIRVVVEELPDAVMIPQRIVREIQGKFEVFVVNDQNIIERRALKMGPKFKDYWIVKEGINPGDKVLYEGTLKIKEGATITPEVVKFESRYLD